MLGFMKASLTHTDKKIVERMSIGQRLYALRDMVAKLEHGFSQCKAKIKSAYIV